MKLNFSRSATRGDVTTSDKPEGVFDDVALLALLAFGVSLFGVACTLGALADALGVLLTATLGVVAFRVDSFGVDAGFDFCVSSAG